MLHSNKFISLKKNIYKLNPKVNLIVVSKNQTMEKLVPIINTKQIHFGENRVQEAIQKWKTTKDQFADLKFHLIGKLQSNKAKEAFDFFDKEKNNAGIDREFNILVEAAEQQERKARNARNATVTAGLGLIATVTGLAAHLFA